MKYILDTDHLSILQRQDGRDWGTVVGHIQRVGQFEVGVSVISFHEQVIGLHAKLIAAKHPSELTRWYRKMADLLDSFSRANVVPFDENVANVLEVLRKAPKVRTKPMDLRIAASAIAYGLTLVTRNRRDFELIDGLRIEDWTK